MPDDLPYAVGYRRPPLHTRFVKGRSGNPGGRPKCTRNLATLLGAALDERVEVGENGKRRTITKRQAIIAQLVNKSAAADLRAIAMLLNMVQQIEARSAAAASGITEAVTTEADEAVIESLARRLRAATEPADDGSRPA